MKRFLAALLIGLAAAPSAQAAPAPKLIVALSVDQLSSSLFREYRPHFTGGLKRLAEGVAYADGFQAHAATETCPGHSTILTGAHPARSGIIANGWIDFEAPRADEAIYCAEDESVPGSTSDDYRVSPTHLGVPTLGDRMKAADPRSRVVSVSVKDRSAVMLGGRHADQLLWAGENGFVGLEGTTPAPVVAQVNRSVLAAIAKPRPPLPLPDFCKPKAVEVTLPNGRTIGTHRFAREAGNKAAFRASPEADAATLALAAALIQQLQLGRGPATDLLAIGLSATDYVGHRYGPGGVEMCLQLTTLDADLGSFFDLLDKTGVDYAVVLTADHGGLDVPERLRLQDVAEAARVEAGATPAGIGKEIAARLGLTEPVFDGDWYVTPSVPEAQRDEVLALARELLSAHPQVHSVYAAAEVAARPMPTRAPSDWSMLDRMRASYHPERSGDLLVALKPHISPVAGLGVVGTHGSPWDYDRKVPILFWWEGITPETRGESVMTVDIMPTLASLIGLPVPAGEIDGRCLDLLAGPETNCPVP